MSFLYLISLAFTSEYSDFENIVLYTQDNSWKTYKILDFYFRNIMLLIFPIFTEEINQQLHEWMDQLLN